MSRPHRLVERPPSVSTGQIETVGLEATLEKEIRSTVKSGDVVNLKAIADFYQNHKSELPEEALPEDSQFRRNVKEKTVDAFFDFRSCSELLQTRQFLFFQCTAPVNRGSGY